ncbi:nitroreductase family protein [Saccharopolyspora erythraea]|uniref:nitroreductase family protein n=1 Tax=Saccharopolyspora erythraea TaxID=1836 RepID=UPI001BA8E172|nr:nitroreductase family protein [Saccharopolyspora erythraea]QUH02657.1 nitroreductase family protein [Saccharopolyspora erythraea]
MLTGLPEGDRHARRAVASSALAPFVQYRPERVPVDEGLRRGQALHDLLAQRRSVRFFSSDPVPAEAIDLAVRTANTAPSGAHQQPWTFVAVRGPETRHRIRLAAEAEERAFYGRDDLPEWHGALARLETGADKEYLGVVPWIVVVFAQKYSTDPTGRRRKHYYVNESVGIACGMFISSLHAMGLATLPHTPNPMGFLNDILGRPGSERPYILFPVGYPAADCEVPDLARKPLEQALVHHP